MQLKNNNVVIKIFFESHYVRHIIIHFIIQRILF